MQLLPKAKKMALYDPYVSSIKVGKKTLRCEATLEEASNGSNCLLFLVDHEAFRKLDLRHLRKLTDERCMLFDAKNLFDAGEVEQAGFCYMGLGKPHRNQSGQATPRSGNQS
jgi:UDP-N-acetyl-D-mannosaminuronate dehydrogenase